MKMQQARRTRLKINNDILVNNQNRIPPDIRPMRSGCFVLHRRPFSDDTCCKFPLKIAEMLAPMTSTTSSETSCSTQSTKPHMDTKWHTNGTVAVGHDFFFFFNIQTKSNAQTKRCSSTRFAKPTPCTNSSRSPDNNTPGGGGLKAEPRGHQLVFFFLCMPPPKWQQRTGGRRSSCRSPAAGASHVAISDPLFVTEIALFSTECN